MTKYDFSSSERRAYLHALQAGEPITDSMFFKAISAIDADRIGLQLKTEPLVEVDEGRNRKRGRPTANMLRRKLLADQVVQLDEGILPHDLRPELVARLRTGRRHKTSVRRAKTNRECQKHLKRMDIRIFYRHALDVLAAGPPYDDELFSLVDIASLDAQSNSDRAMMMVAELLHMIGARPPSIRRMHNIVSENSFF